MRRTPLERTTGVEPAFDGFAVRTLTVRDHSHMAEVMRFEHTHNTVLETVALPIELHPYMVLQTGIEPVRHL